MSDKDADEEPIVATRIEGPLEDAMSSISSSRPTLTPVQSKTVQQPSTTRQVIVSLSSSSAARTSSAASSVVAPVTPSSSSVSSSTRVISSSSSSSSVVPSSSTSSSSSSSSSSSARPSSSLVASSSSSSVASSSSVSPKVVTVTSSFSTSVSRSSSASASTSSSTLAAGSNGTEDKSNSLGTGVIVGIVIGALALIVVIGLLITRTVRKRARAKRTANRTSIMDWNPPAGFEEKDDIDPYTPPAQSQSYAMQPSYPSDMGYQHQPPLSHTFQEQQFQASYGAPQQNYPVQYPPAMAPAAPAIPTAAAAAPSHGLINGSMVRVKQGFVRSLDDELAVVPDQQLYLHTAYDDGWCLCEDGNRDKGMVPLTCLEAWIGQGEQQTGMTRSNTEGSLTNRSERRTSLYADANAAGAYLNAQQQ